MTSQKYPSYKSILRRFMSGCFIFAGVIAFPFLLHSIIHDNLSKKDLLTRVVESLSIAGTIITFLHWHINQEIKEAEEKVREEIRNIPDQKTANIDLSADVLRTAKTTLGEVLSNSNLSESEKETIASILNDLNALEEDTEFYHTALSWLESKDKRIDLSEYYGNYVLSEYPFRLFNPKKDKSKKTLYRNIYHCLIWIQDSLKAGDYLDTNPPRVSDIKRTTKALKHLKEKVLPKQLPSEAVQHLEIYFEEVIRLINKKKK